MVSKTSDGMYRNFSVGLGNFHFILQSVLLSPLGEVSDKKLKVVQNDSPFLAMEFLGSFAKLLKAITSFVTSVCQSVLLSAWSNLAPTGRMFMKFGISVFFEYLA